MSKQPRQSRPMGLDDQFKSGRYVGMHLWAVLEIDEQFVRRLVEETDFQLDNEAYAKVFGIHTGAAAISVGRREARL